jgi:hypothetical protein
VPLYYVGLDLGQASDYSALCVIEEQLWCGPEVDFSGWGAFVPPELEDAGWVSPSLLSPRSASQVYTINRELGRPPHPPLYLRHLERHELGTPYPEVISRVIRLLTRHPIRAHLERSRLIVDATGVGRPVVDSFRAQGVRPVGITIHGGDTVTAEAPGPEILNLRVPKRDLVAAVQTTLQTKRLQIAAQLPLAATLRKELLNFRIKINPKTAHDSYSHWREGDHDDLVLATAVACWYREVTNVLIEQRNREQGGYRVPVSSGVVEPFFKGELEPFIKDSRELETYGQPNPWRELKTERRAARP